LPPWLNADFVQRTRLTARRQIWTASLAESLETLHGPFWSRLVGMANPGNTGLDLPIARPFLDVRLVELAARLPAPMLRGKHILREVMKPWLPAAILERPKTPLGQAQAYLRSRPDVISRHLDLLDQTPAMAAYVDVPTLRVAIAAPSVNSNRHIGRCEGLAAWLLAHASGGTGAT
jgi:hypothetical protein